MQIVTGAPVYDTSAAWLQSIGLQQYSAAFFAAGYADTDTLKGLSRKHVNEVALYQQGGISSAHTKLLLASAKQFSGHQVAGLQESQLLHTAAPDSQLTSPGASAPQIQVHATSSNDQSSQQAVQASALGRLHQDRLANTASSYSSASSFYTEESTSEASLASFTSEADSARPVPHRLASQTKQDYQSTTRAQDTGARPGPTQADLLQLYSAMQEDYRRLQMEHPAPVRPQDGSDWTRHTTSAVNTQAALQPSESRQPQSVPTAPGTRLPVLSVANRERDQGHQQPHANAATNGAPLPAVASKLQKPRLRAAHAVRQPVAKTASAKRKLTTEQLANPSPAQQESDKVGLDQKNTVAQRRRRTGLHADPFVHIYTNFHTITKVGLLHPCLASQSGCKCGREHTQATWTILA